MLSSSPLVSCIMPTYNRRQFIPNAIQYFLNQDYPNKELIIVDDGEDCIEDLVPRADTIRYFRLEKKITLGAKLNYACNLAKGEIIAHWDDDDWYATWRISYQITELVSSKKSICGINNLFYYDLKHKKAYQYQYPKNQKIWLSGSSLCYWKKLWQEKHFADINVGMDGLFVWALNQNKIKVLDNSSFSVLFIHKNNVSPKKTQGSWWHIYSVDNIKQIIGRDWHKYGEEVKKEKKQITDSKSSKIQTKNIRNPISTEPIGAQIRNIFACLVHENEDCVIDLVRNLKFHDSSSVILLYDGSPHSNLLQSSKLYTSLNVLIYPHPKPQKHGYLHHFALDCMRFAVKNLDFDTLTIVDSDQLCIRSGYSKFISRTILANDKIGMFSSNPSHFTHQNSNNNFVAQKALKEFELWKPFLESFPDGINKFVHWTFWPSTVFTKKAIEEIVNLFDNNKLLNKIMSYTKIWATEEVIFPTLVKLLGYDILQNHCSLNFVKYQTNWNLKDLNHSYRDINSYWIHPVPRKYSNILRKKIRKKFNDYKNLKMSDKNITYRHLKNRTDLIIFFINTRQYKSYLEIGVDNEKSNFIHIKCDYKVGVDPKAVTTFKGTSDMFFKQNKTKFDVIFIDGLHTEEQVVKDISNSKNHLKDGGIIILHDCMPPNAWYQREFKEYKYGEAWTGTVWKAALKEFNSSKYKCFLLDMDWGCGIIDTNYHQESKSRKIPQRLDYAFHYEWFMDYKITQNEFFHFYSKEITSSKKKIDVTIILIAYNNSDKVKMRLQREVIPTIKAHKNWNFKVILVDNSDNNMTLDIPNLDIEFIYLKPTKNLMYGPSINLAVEHCDSPYIVYLCTNHGKVFDTSWIDDLITPLLIDSTTAMTGSIYPSCHPSKMNFPNNLPPKHIQGGIFAAKTEILKLCKYTEDPKWIHGGSDIYQSFQLLNSGYDLFDVASIKSVWKKKVPNPQNWKYVHDESEN